MASYLKEKYETKVRKELQKKFHFESAMAVPKILKVTLNSGVGKFLKEKESMDEIVRDLMTIAGQKPVLTKSKKSISGFKTREGQEIGVKLTLRGNRMWFFLERLVAVALPRVRDFRGIDPENIDQNGNLNLAVKEQIVFPEIVPENVRTIFSFQVNVTTTAKNKEQGLEMFKLLGFPIKIS